MSGEGPRWSSAHTATGQGGDTVLSQVRCAAVFALGTFVGNSAERTDHSTTIDHNVAMMLAQLINDGSPVVRKVCGPWHRQPGPQAPHGRRRLSKTVYKLQNFPLSERRTVTAFRPRSHALSEVGSVQPDPARPRGVTEGRRGPVWFTVLGRQEPGERGAGWAAADGGPWPTQSLGALSDLSSLRYLSQHRKAEAGVETV